MKLGKKAVTIFLVADLVILGAVALKCYSDRQDERSNQGVCAGVVGGDSVVVSNIAVLMEQNKKLAEAVKGASYVSNFVQGRAFIRRNGKYGVICSNGNQVVPCEYDVKGFISEEDGSIILKNGKGEGTQYIFDRDGQLVTQFKANDLMLKGFSEGMIKAWDPKTNLYGFLNSKGEQVIKCVWTEVGEFSEGLAAVVVDGKFGYVDKTGALVIPCQYEKSQRKKPWPDFHDGFIPVRLKSGDSDYERLAEHVSYESRSHLYKYVNKAGQCVFDKIFDTPEDFHEGLLRYNDPESGCTVYYNTKGHLVFKLPKGVIGEAFSESLALAYNDQALYFVDKTGQKVFDLTGKYVRALSFENGVARVYAKDGSGGYINRNGELIYSRKAGEAIPFSD